MIDIKAIRAAAENYPSPWPMSLQPNTVLALCDEIERLRTKLEVTDKTGYDGIDCRDETIRLQDEEIERLRKDAARYQWLKDRATASHVQHYKLDYPTTWHIVTGGSDTNIDAAIDAAMKDEQK